MLEEADKNENNGGHDNGGTGAQLLLNKPLIEGVYYDKQDMLEQQNACAVNIEWT